MVYEYFDTSALENCYDYAEELEKEHLQFLNEKYPDLDEREKKRLVVLYVLKECCLVQLETPELKAKYEEYSKRYEKLFSNLQHSSVRIFRG